MRTSRRVRYGWVRETGKPIAQVARDLGVNAGTLGNWLAKAALNPRVLLPAHGPIPAGTGAAFRTAQPDRLDPAHPLRAPSPARARRRPHHPGLLDRL